jgi:glycosyltransferase involved in cell wall biosynthesis
MKILWLSNCPWAGTGYGTQTRLFVPRLKKILGHDMAIAGFYGIEGGVIHWDGIPVYPRAFHPYGNDCYSAHAKHFGADLILTLHDLWVFNTADNVNGLPIASWFPVDSDPIPPPVAAVAKLVDFRVALSKFAAKQLDNIGLDYFYVPHGVDTKVFKPLDKAEARKFVGLPEDKYIVGMVAANKGHSPSRKAFAENIAAFAELRKRHKNVLLYVHTCTAEAGENQGVNLVELCESLGLKIGEDVIFANQYVHVLSFPEPYMVNLYNSFDVLLSVTMGEGFGIPIIEAQACGTPVIVGEWTSMPELLFGGWKVGKEDAYPFWTGLASYQFVPRIGAIVDCLENAYKHSSDFIKQNARVGAEAYDADLITEMFWKPTLETIEKRINEVMAPLPAPVLEPVVFDLAGQRMVP